MTEPFISTTSNFEMEIEKWYAEFLQFEQLFADKDQSPGLFTWETHFHSHNSPPPLDSRYPCKVTTYRGEDGGLLGFALYYRDETDHPFIEYILVHPDHQRQGIGRKITDFIVQQYELETGLKYPYVENVAGVANRTKVTSSVANYLNKHVPNAINDPVFTGDLSQFYTGPSVSE